MSVRVQKGVSIVNTLLGIRHFISTFYPSSSSVVVRRRRRRRSSSSSVVIVRRPSSPVVRRRLPSFVVVVRRRRPSSVVRRRHPLSGGLPGQQICAELQTASPHTCIYIYIHILQFPLSPYQERCHRVRFTVCRSSPCSAMKSHISF